MAKADSEVRNFKGETPQQLAHLCQNRYLVRLCQNYGAGSYQLEFAETEAVINESSDDDDDDDDDERLNSVSILFPKLEDMNIDSR